MNDLTFERAWDVATWYLGHEARSRVEIERRLSRDEFPSEIIQAVVTALTARGWLDDQALAHAWIADRAERKRYGRTRLALELSRKGVDKETIEDVVATVDPEIELRSALELARSRWRIDPEEFGDRDALLAARRRLEGFLRRRGFSWNVITQVFSELSANAE